MKAISEFLKKNGFKQDKDAIYRNDKCMIIIYADSFEIVNNDDTSIHSFDLNIYWLVGVLTWYGYISKNYKQ